EGAPKVLYVLELLPGAAGAVWADREDAVLRLHRGRPAEGALLRRLRLAGALLPALDDRRDDLRDDVAGAHYDHLVSLADVLASQVLLVMQRRRAHRDPADVNGLEHRERQQMAGAADVPDDLVELRGGGRRGELPGNGPARLTPGHPQLPLQTAVVDLDHHAVDLEVQGLPPALPPATALGDLVDAVQDRDVLVHPEAPVAKPLEGLGVAGRLPALQRS